MRHGAGRLLTTASALAVAGCTRSYRPEYIAGSDLESRYPPVVERASEGVVRAAAVALVLFTAWLAADVAIRRAGRHQQGGALLTAFALVALLAVGSLVVGTSGAYPRGRPYEVATIISVWVGPVALVAGIAWLIIGFRSRPGDRGQAVWGLFLVFLGLVTTPIIVSTSFSLWVCC